MLIAGRSASRSISVRSPMTSPGAPTVGATPVDAACAKTGPANTGRAATDCPGTGCPGTGLATIGASSRSTTGEEGETPASRGLPTSRWTSARSSITNPGAPTVGARSAISGSASSGSASSGSARNGSANMGSAGTGFGGELGTAVLTVAGRSRPCTGLAPSPATSTRLWPTKDLAADPFGVATTGWFSVGAPVGTSVSGVPSRNRETRRPGRGGTNRPGASTVSGVGGIASAGRGDVLEPAGRPKSLGAGETEARRCRSRVKLGGHGL